jgi:hypothetical protein
MTRTKWSARIACAWLVTVTLGVSVTWSQQSESLKDRPTRKAAPKRSAWLHEVYLREAAEYEFYRDDQRHDKLELRREPAMRWTSEGDYHGEVYVWTSRGTAAVVGCIFSGPQGAGDRQIMHEFHSLCAQPLIAGERRGSGWQPGEAGITLEPIPDAPEPAKTKVLRLAQMRELARRFSSQVDRQGGMSEMRLLTQPIYRYETADGGSVADGAVFAFVWTAGTDPEVLLVIEARREESRGLQWRYAPARFTNREARVRYRGKEIWRVEAATAGIFDGVTNKRYGAFSIKTIHEPIEPQ